MHFFKAAHWLGIEPLQLTAKRQKTMVKAVRKRMLVARLEWPAGILFLAAFNIDFLHFEVDVGSPVRVLSRDSILAL